MSGGAVSKAGQGAVGGVVATRDPWRRTWGGGLNPGWTEAVILQSPRPCGWEKGMFVSPPPTLR